MDTVEILKLIDKRWSFRNVTWDAVLRNDQKNAQIVFASAQALKTTTPSHPALNTFKIPSFLLDAAHLESNGFCGAQLVQDEQGYHHITYSRFIVKKIFDALRPKPTFTPRIASRDNPPNPAENLNGRVQRKEASSIHNRRTTAFGWEWFEMGFFMHVGPDMVVTILALDAPTKLKESLKEALQGVENASIGDPYELFSLLVDRLIALYNDSVWSIRNHVCQREATRPEETDFPLLHETARHAIHVSETLQVALRSVTSLAKQAEGFIKLTKDPNIGWNTQFPSHADRTASDKLQHQCDFIAALLLRNESNAKRIDNEITLAFNTAAQRDSKIQVRLAESAVRETLAMKAIAVLTMIFLPATFVSSVFGMQFFYVESGNGQEPVFVISEKFWVFWAIAAPLSIVTIVTWLVWEARLKKTL